MKTTQLLTWIGCNVTIEAQRPKWTAYNVEFKIKGVTGVISAKIDISRAKSLEGEQMFFLVEHHGVVLN